MQRMATRSLLIAWTCGFIAAVYMGCGYEDAFNEKLRNTPSQCAPEEGSGPCIELYKCGNREPLIVNIKEGEACTNTAGESRICLSGICTSTSEIDASIDTNTAPECDDNTPCIGEPHTSFVVTKGQSEKTKNM